MFQPDDKVSIKFSDKFNYSLKVLPLLYLEFIRIATIHTKRIELDQQALSTNDKIHEILRDAEVLQPKNNFIRPAISAILGVDAIDGEMNTIEALSSTLGVSSTALANTLLAAAGVIGAGILVKSDNYTDK